MHCNLRKVLPTSLYLAFWGLADLSVCSDLDSGHWKNIVWSFFNLQLSSFGDPVYNLAADSSS